jgi:hypothetical protein
MYASADIKNVGQGYSLAFAMCDWMHRAYSLMPVGAGFSRTFPCMSGYAFAKHNGIALRTANLKVCPTKQQISLGLIFYGKV